MEDQIRFPTNLIDYLAFCGLAERVPLRTFVCVFRVPWNDGHAYLKFNLKPGTPNDARCGMLFEVMVECSFYLLDAAGQLLAYRCVLFVPFSYAHRSG